MENLSKEVGLLKFPIAVLTAAVMKQFQDGSQIQPLQRKLLYELDPLPSPFPLPISLKILSAR